MTPVLRALAGSDKAFTIRHLARVAGVSPSRAQQVIRRLSQHGLALIDEQGPSSLCILNREHLAASPLIELVRLRTTMLEFLRKQIGQWRLPPEHASLFGSAARGDGDTTSDIDILVIRPPLHEDTAWREQLFETESRAFRATGNHVAWFDLTQAELTNAARAGEPIVQEWMRDGLPLAGPNLRTLLRAAS